jgi:transcriptional regulatory protein RtcR
MSALFGHLKGSFTGAMRDRPGLLRQAHGGVLFLDEIGELGLDEQAMLLRAIEDKTFLPVGADREVSSDFQLIAGTNRELRARVKEGAFREDLLARIDLWHFRLPGLRDRVQDLEPNLDFELDRATRTLGTRITMSREARARFVAFATSPEARWPGNFRDLNAAITRMATLAPGGRVDEATVDEEVARLRAAWGEDGEPDLVALALGPERAAALDRFDRVQLEEVLRACRACESLSEAGRLLFAASRAKKATTNDAHRLRQYLAKHGLDFEAARRG